MCLPPPPPLPQAYEFATAAKGLYTSADFNASLLYNSSTYYDDLGGGDSHPAPWGCT